MSNTLTSKLSFWERINRKLLLCVSLSFCAALGTLTYGYEFANYFNIDSKYFLMYAGGIFAISAVLANMVLGTYSLTNIDLTKIKFPILVVSTVGAIPYGFLCYFGYKTLLPSVINITISSIVVIVNAGIGYTAFQNLWDNIKSNSKKSIHKQTDSLGKNVVSWFGFLIGLAISVLTYLAASHGITDLMINYNLTTLVDYHAGYFLAILSWLPCAALFANANQVVAGDLYTQLADFKKFVSNISLVNIAFFIFCLFSGTAIAQMVSDSFATTKHIPEFFKADAIQMLIPYLIPIGLFSSAALNYFAIDNLLKQFKKK